jgi:hypothetical protein
MSFLTVDDHRVAGGCRYREICLVEMQLCGGNFRLPKKQSQLSESELVGGWGTSTVHSGLQFSTLHFLLKVHWHRAIITVLFL